MNWIDEVQNLYELLRLSQTASVSMISDAYQSLNSRAATDEERRKLLEAFEVLTDGERRADYDQMLHSVVAEEMATLKENIAKNPELYEEPRLLKTNSPPSGGGMYRDLLLPHVGKGIGINRDQADKFLNARLFGAQNEYFTVEGGAGVVHVPYQKIMQILEVPTGGSNRTAVSFALSTSLIVEIYHLIIYKSKGGFMVGGTFPIGE